MTSTIDAIFSTISSSSKSFDRPSLGVGQQKKQGKSEVAATRPINRGERPRAGGTVDGLDNSPVHGLPPRRLEKDILGGQPRVRRAEGQSSAQSAAPIGAHSTKSVKIKQMLAQFGNFFRRTPTGRKDATQAFESRGKVTKSALKTPRLSEIPELAGDWGDEMRALCGSKLLEVAVRKVSIVTVAPRPSSAARLVDPSADAKGVSRMSAILAPVVPPRKSSRRKQQELVHPASVAHEFMRRAEQTKWSAAVVIVATSDSATPPPIPEKSSRRQTAAALASAGGRAGV